MTRACGGLDVIRAYVEGQARLGYAIFDPPPRSDDVILATFPKSGSTWTSYLLHQIKSRCSDEFRDIKDVMVDITPGHWDPGRQPFQEEQSALPRTYKTHGSRRLCPKGAKYIYVARDPKDIFWSLYKFIHDLLGIEESVPLDRFYPEYFVRRFDTGHDIGNVWDYLVDWHRLYGAENMLWLHCEDLVNHRLLVVRKIADHMGVPLGEADQETLLRHSSMEHMRTISRKINPSPDNYVGKIVAGFGELTRGYARRMSFGKLRKGVPGDGARCLPAELAQEMDREWKERIEPRLGYPDYAAMRAACSIVPADGCCAEARPATGNPQRERS